MAEPPPSDAELRATIERLFAAEEIPAPQAIRRHPSEYRTSFPLEQLDLTLDDGTDLRLAFKRLAWNALDEEARLAKPKFLHDPEREPVVYESILAPAVPDAPRYYGSCMEPEAGRYWLFIEWVEGKELYQVGDRRRWEAAARWLARMHGDLGGLGEPDGSAHLLDFDEAHYRRWIERAVEFGPVGSSQIESLAGRYEPVIEGLLEMPKTVIHGEFYASNVLVKGEPSAARVAPVDWELAATAPGVIDLAALISGDWSDEDRAAIVAAYRSAAGSHDFSPRQLDLARLHLAVQWLGWAPASWTPPESQRHDWLTEALELAERLGL